MIVIRSDWSGTEITGPEADRKREAYARAKAERDRCNDPAEKAVIWDRMERIVGNRRPFRA